MGDFNHQMVCMARDTRSMTQADLATKMRIGQGTLSKYESGIIVPPDDAISELASALGYPKSLFFESGTPYGFPPFHFRRRKKLGKKALNRIVAEMNLRRIHVRQLLRAFDSGSSGYIPEIDFDEFQGASRNRVTIDDVARHVRETWMIPQGPVENMVDLIERSGGIVIPCDFGTDLIDAMSQRIDGLPVLFFINSKSPTDRIRHTLAHELAHMVLHTMDMKQDDEMESEADRFAGAFLLPADEIRFQLRRFDLRHLANLKKHWKVSMASIAMRADQLDLITPYQKRSFWIEMGKLGYRRREPHEPPAETPRMLMRMIQFHRVSLDYSDEEMAALLHLTPKEFDMMYGAGSSFSPEKTRPKLTLVK